MIWNELEKATDLTQSIVSAQEVTGKETDSHVNSTYHQVSILRPGSSEIKVKLYKKNLKELGRKQKIKQ